MSRPLQGTTGTEKPRQRKRNIVKQNDPESFLARLEGHFDEDYIDAIYASLDSDKELEYWRYYEFFFDRVIGGKTGICLGRYDPAQKPELKSLLGCHEEDLPDWVMLFEKVLRRRPLLKSKLNESLTRVFLAVDVAREYQPRIVEIAARFVIEDMVAVDSGADYFLFHLRTLRHAVTSGQALEIITKFAAVYARLKDEESCWKFLSDSQVIGRIAEFCPDGMLREAGGGFADHEVEVDGAGHGEDGDDKEGEAAADDGADNAAAQASAAAGSPASPGSQPAGPARLVAYFTDVGLPWLAERYAQMLKDTTVFESLSRVIDTLRSFETEKDLAALPDHEKRARVIASIQEAAESCKLDFNDTIRFTWSILARSGRMTSAKDSGSFLKNWGALLTHFTLDSLEGQVYLLSLAQKTCYENPALIEAFRTIVIHLYSVEALDASVIVAWYRHGGGDGKIGFADQVEEFVQWLEEATEKEE